MEEKLQSLCDVIYGQLLMVILPFLVAQPSPCHQALDVNFLP